jgi:hypothetical protein
MVRIFWARDAGQNNMLTKRTMAIHVPNFLTVFIIVIVNVL